jgi:hypothetical protein
MAGDGGGWFNNFCGLFDNDFGFVEQVQLLWTPFFAAGAEVAFF